MTYNDLRRSIYESYQSGEISGPQATQMLEKVMDIEGDHIVAEYEALESTFMGVAMEAANGYMDFSDFQEQAQVYTEGVKEIWEKFVDWVKGIISAIFGIKFKGNPTIEVNSDKMSRYQKFTAYCKKIASGKTDEGLIAGLVGLAATAGASIFAGHKVKMKYKKFAQIQQAAIDSGKDVVEWMTDPKNADNELLKQIGARGQATLKKVFEGIKNDKKGVVGMIYKHIAKKINKTREELEKDHSNDGAADDDTVSAKEAEEKAKKEAEEARKKAEEEDAFRHGTFEPPTDDDGNIIAASAHSDFASGSILSESSSWDDIFAYMDI